MKRFLNLFFCLFAALSLWAVTPSDTLTLAQLEDALREDPGRAGGTKLNYPFGPYSVAPAPKGYKPFYISHYGRHGARFATQAAKYDAVAKLFTTGHDKGALTEKGEDFYHRYMEIYPLLKGHEGDLTEKGQEQHRELARRMVAAYPSVFRKAPRVDARATVSPRAIISMMSFCDELRVERPRVDIQYAANHTDLPVTALRPTPEQAEASRIKSYGDIFKGEDFTNGMAAAARSIGLDEKAFFLRYFKDLEVVKECGSPRESMNAMDEVVTNLQNLDFNVDLGDVFTEEERFKLFESGNLYAVLMFQDNPYSKGLMSARAWPLLQDIIDRADEDIASGQMQARLRFGHDTVVGPLMALLGIDGWTALGADMTRWKYWFQGWNIPMASNLQFVFYRNKKNPSDILVRLMYNEKDQILPLPDQSLAPYYRWSDFETWYKPICERAKAFIDEFLFEEESL